jgi:DnaJ domain/Bacterial regulatory protein, Fis family
MKRLSLDQIVQAYRRLDGGSRTMQEAATTLGVSRRTLYYKLERASKAELAHAYRRLVNGLYDALRAYEQEYDDLAKDDRDVRRKYLDLGQAYADLQAEMRQLLAENQRLRLRTVAEEGGHGRVSRGDDPYRLLGVRPDAPPEVIEAAWKALAKQYHADRTGGSDAKMQQINAAHDQLKRRA